MTYALTRRGLAALPLVLMGARSAVAQIASPADARFADLARRFLERLLQTSPIRATTLGDHRFDHRLDDISTAARSREIAAAKALLKEAQAIPARELGPENQVDLAVLKNTLAYGIWSGEVLQDWAWDPQIYNDLAGSALYGLMAREFAPAPVRLRAAIARMEALPAFLAQARRELQPARVPPTHAQTVARQNAGLMSIVDDMILPKAGELPAAEQARLRAAADKLRAASAEHQVWLDNTLVPQAKGDFRLGARLYDEKLAFALMSPLDRAEVRRRAEVALKATRARMHEVSRGVLAAGGKPVPDREQAAIEAALELVYADRAPRGQLVEASRAALDQATAFTREKDLITLPDAPVQVILMPEFQRGFAVAYCDPPGPLDKQLDTFYAVSPIPDDWTEAQAQSFLREYNIRGLHDVAIHEGVPGHYTQLWHGNKHPSVLRAVLWSGPFVEGWAVYAEEMMADAGYLGGDPLFRLQQLKMRVRTITNALLDQMVHVDGAGEAEVMNFLTVTAFQQEREAAGKWVRAQLSSAQLPTYFVGVSEHDELRAEARRREGAGFQLKRFHDRLLSFGAPPVRYARALMFDEPIV
jgi:uncharacterized protein (DUF885 family)